MEPKLQGGYRVLLEAADVREVVTARRERLLETLYHERYLTRPGLIWRLEGVLGKGCIGKVVPWFEFYRDMRTVKAAFLASGYELAYSRKKKRRGYYLRGEGETSEELAQRIKGAVDEVDPVQIAITRRLSPAQRVRQGCSLTDLAHSVVRYRQDKNKGA